ncbi:MAG: CBS domain-containing protein, partial [Gammaproteobacteria bacterium]|nr:CBS domain-containing protein [Gammaproteobacteria bacterium]
MAQDTVNIEAQTEGNLVDYIVEHLNTGDDATIIGQLEQLHSAEIATVLESLPPEHRQRLWKLLPQGLEGDTLTYLGEEVRASIIGEMEDAEVVAATESMDVDDLANVMIDLPEHITEAVLKSLDEDRRDRLEVTLSFAEGTAGRLMGNDVISVRTDVSLAVVIRYLRRLKPLPPHTDALMVTNDEGQYLGKLTLADTISEHPNTLVADVMKEGIDRVQV